MEMLKSSCGGLNILLFSNVPHNTSPPSGGTSNKQKTIYLFRSFVMGAVEVSHVNGWVLMAQNTTILVDSMYFTSIYSTAVSNKSIG